jgi:hypothetical protein
LKRPKRKWPLKSIEGKSASNRPKSKTLNVSERFTKLKFRKETSKKFKKIRKH